MRMPLLHYFVVVGSVLERRMNECGDKQPEENRRDHQREGENHRDPSAMPDVTNNPPQRRRDLWRPHNFVADVAQQFLLSVISASVRRGRPSVGPSGQARIVFPS